MIDKLKQFFSTPKKVVTITHQNPDGDAVGSSLAMHHILIQMGHQVQVIVPNNFAEFLKYHEGVDDILQFDKNETTKLQTAEVIAAADCIVILDLNDLKRTGVIAQYIEASNAFKVLIDHHLEPQHFADYMLSDTTASSTAELIFRFAEQLGWQQYVNKTVAECIYMGILTDTGKFSHSVTQQLHETVGKLIEAGADVKKADIELFNNYSFGRMRFWGFCLGQKLKTIPGLKAAILPLSIKEMHRFNVQKGFTEGLVNQGLAIKNIEVSIMLKEEHDKIKLSLRSKSDFSVNEMARTHFNGGGHKNASGGMLEIPLSEAIKKVESVLHLYDELK